MEIRALRYFVAVAASGSVTAAAAALHLTQPSMSRQIRQLERELGMDLFARDESKFRLSAAGRAFLPTAERLLAQVDQARGVAAEIAAGRLQSVTIAAPGTTLTDVIAPFLATWGPGDPMPEVREEVPVSVYATLGRDADLAIGTTPWSAPFAGLPIADLPVWAYVRADHPWAQRSSVSLAELLGEPLLLLTGSYHPRRALDHAVAAAALAYGDIHEFTSAEVAQAVAASGRGIAVVSDDTRFGLHPLAVRAPTGPLHISLFAVWEQAHHGAATLRTIAERLAAFCITRYGTDAAPKAR